MKSSLAEHARDDRRIGIVPAAQLFGMDPGRDEQAVDAKFGGAFQIGAHGIPDRQNSVERNIAPVRREGLAQRLLVDRTMRLAGVEHLSSQRPVEVGDGAGTVDEMIAALDHHVRVGAHHVQLALAHLGEHRPVILRRIGVVVEQSGADDVIRLANRREPHREPIKDRQVAVGPR